MVEVLIATAAAVSSAQESTGANLTPVVTVMGAFILGLLATLIWRPVVTPAGCLANHTVITNTLTQYDTQIRENQKDIACLSGNIMPLLRVIEEKTNRIVLVESKLDAFNESLRDLVSDVKVLTLRTNALDEKVSELTNG